MNELLTLSEVALRLRVSRRTVERLVASGRIRTVRPSPGRTCVTGREIAAMGPFSYDLDLIVPAILDHLTGGTR